MYNENPNHLEQSLDYCDLNKVLDFWIKYEGEFKNDCKEGFGKLYLSNGEIYSGIFKSDTING